MTSRLNGVPAWSSGTTVGPTKILRFNVEDRLNVTEADITILRQHGVIPIFTAHQPFMVGEWYEDELVEGDE